MKIEKLKISSLIPYENNAKLHPQQQIDQIVASIKEFGFNDAIAIDENNVIIEGHGRWMALKQMGVDEVECIRLSHLTDEQKKAYILIHNKLTMNTGFDIPTLEMELQDIEAVDMTEFGFDMGFIFEEDGYYGDERERTNDAYNLGLAEQSDLTNDFWQMPIIKNDNFIPSDLTGFNYAKTNKEKNTGIHFYIDDYQFERVWNNPEKYVDVLMDYECILSPDFSLYMDMPMPMKIWNIYRSRQIGAFYQSQGIKVIPTISWAEPETFEFCFQGIPKGSIVSVSTIGVKQNKEALQIWEDGMREMIRRIEPSTILVYGGKLDFDYGNIKVIYFDNKVTKRWSEKE